MAFSVSMFPSLQMALSKNPDLEKILNDKCSENKRFFSHLEELFRELLNGGCTGVLDKMRDVHSIAKMVSCTAELFIGRQFLRKRFSVEFLPDNYSIKCPPDLAAEKDGNKILIELMRIGDGPFPMSYKKS